MAKNLQALRGHFPLLERKTYLNSGSYCALADSVRDAINAYMDDRLLVGANWDVWVMKNEAVRERMAQLLHAAPDEIAVTASASAGLNALASALDFTGARRKVVVSDFEFPTNAQIWHAQERRGARVVHVPRASDRYIPAENFAPLIDDETLLVAVTHVCFRNGAKLDIPGIVRLARAGTAGIGFLYVRGELIPTLTPTNSGWFAQEQITAMDITANRPSPTARRFEAGTPAVVNCYAAEAGLKIILDAGMDAIETRVRQRCLDGLAAIGWPAVTPPEDARRGAMVAVPARDTAQLFARLMEQDIVTSFRDANIRATIHFYNSEADIDTFVAAMQGHRARYHPGP